MKQNVQLIATYSGGVQKKTFFYRVPCVTLHDESEQLELIKAGWNRFTQPYSTETITEKIYEGLDNKWTRFFHIRRGMRYSRLE